MNITNNARRLIGAATLATVGLATFAAGPVDAARRPTIDLHGRGAAVDEGWRQVVSGQATGRPFRAAFTGSVQPDGGVWPEQGECATGSASMYVDGPHRKEIWIIALGDICSPYDDGVSAVDYSFVGQFDAYEARPRRLADTQGFVEVVVADDASVNLTLVSF